MGQWKRTLRNTGISLTVAGVGVMGAAGAASAHGAGAQEFVRGTVTTVGTGTITITTHNGTMETIDTTTTTYSETGTLVAPTGVTDGQDVLVKLDPADTTPTAVEITVILDRVSGKVTAFTSTSITLGGPWGKTGDVEVSSPGTTYYDGKTTATGVTVGEYVIAFGTWDTTTTPPELDALFVDIGSTTVCPPRSPRITPTPVVPFKGPDTDPSTTTWGPQTHTPAAAPSVVSTAGSTPKFTPPTFSRGADPQTTGAPGPSGQGQGRSGFSGGPGAAGPGAGSHGFSGGPGSHGGRG
jgi:uncharacterized membrane protein YgcG